MAKILFFARARELADCDHWETDLPKSTTVARLRNLLSEKFPRLKPLLEKSAIAVAGAFANEETLIEADAEIAVLPPVSGG